MTQLLDRPVAPPAVVAPEPVVEETASLSVLRVAVAGGLAAAGSAFVVGGMFSGALARVVGMVAAAVAAAVVGAAVHRGRTWLQYLVAPGVFVTGYLVALVLPNPTGVTGTVPSLVRHALRNGGLGHPPVPFDPGWRFLVCVVVGLVAAAAVSLAAGFRNPQLAVLVPVPLLVGAALNQPRGDELLTSLVGLGLVLVALSVSFSAELSGDSSPSRGFEVRQLLRALGATTAALVLLGTISQAGFLFPARPPSHAARPVKPKVVPLSQVRDRALFSVTTTGGPVQGPWRVGVLDSYRDDAWYLPGYDPSGYVDDGTLGPDPVTAVTSTVTVRDLEGFTLPTYVGSRTVTTDVALQADPVSGTFRTKDGAPRTGLTYTLRAAKAPSGDEIARLATRPGDPAFLPAPAMPVEIERLLAKAPQNPWERLQVLRSRLYREVVAAGSGVPTDVPPAKVVAMLNGGKATPFEIVAGEALLARWAGLPSRIGYGYYGGSSQGGATEFRPRDGANWLEVLLPGRGWVSVVGTPRRAQSSLSSSARNDRPPVLPSDRLTLQVYVPVLNSDPQLLFEVVRFWVARIVPLLAGGFLLWRLTPLLARLVRSRRRRRWAREHGPAGRIAVAYAEWRDTASDLGLDDGTATPLGFLTEVDDDVEHQELAWLTTRGLWGDLTRDLRDEDAAAAEALSRSLRSRLRRGQTPFVQLAGLTSRASLRRPYDPALPGAWPQLHVPTLALTRLVRRQA